MIFRDFWGHIRRLKNALLRRGSNRLVIIEDLPDVHDIEPTFIIGCPRSGTSLLRRIIDSHSEIACPPESHFLAPVLELLEHRRGMIGLESMGFSREAVINHLKGFINTFFIAYANANGKYHWADKTPIYIDYLEAIDEVYAGNVQYIMLYRHGLDVAYSLTSAMSGFLEQIPNYSSKSDCSDVVSLAAAYWREQTKKMQSFQKNHVQRCYELRYEELVTAPDQVLPGMFEFLGLPYETNVLEFYKTHHDNGLEDGRVVMTEGFEPSIGNYHKWKPEEIEKALTEAEPMMSELGYTV